MTRTGAGLRHSCHSRLYFLKGEWGMRYVQVFLFAFVVFASSSWVAGRGPATWVVDIALAKNFRITESKRLQIRADAFNAFNHVNYMDPDNGSLSATFGRLLT